MAVEPMQGTVDGVVVDRATSARAVFEALSQAFLCDAVESEGRIRFRPRAGAPVRHALQAGDLVEEGEDEPWRKTRAQETEIPAVVKLSYGEFASDDQPAGVEARRTLGGSRLVQQVDLPCTMDEGRARTIAETLLREAWVGREALEAVLPPSLIALDPGDVVRFEEAGNETWRIGEIADGAARPGAARAHRRQPVRGASGARPDAHGRRRGGDRPAGDRVPRRAAAAGRRRRLARLRGRLCEPVAGRRRALPVARGGGLRARFRAAGAGAAGGTDLRSLLRPGLALGPGERALPDAADRHGRLGERAAGAERRERAGRRERGRRVGGRAVPRRRADRGGPLPADDAAARPARLGARDARSRGGRRAGRGARRGAGTAAAAGRPRGAAAQLARRAGEPTRHRRELRRAAGRRCAAAAGGRWRRCT